MSAATSDPPLTPLLVPLGESALVIKYADRFDPHANRVAIAMARLLATRDVPGVLEVVPNLVSVLVRFDPAATRFDAVAGEVRLLTSLDFPETGVPKHHRVSIRFGGPDGPDLDAVAEGVGMSVEAFIDAHNATPLHVLATGFAPGFVYCGMHDERLHLPRRSEVRTSVSAGSVLFAAGQTAIAATPIPTGWHVIGHTDFRNFDPAAVPPTHLRPGDIVSFEAMP
ncbi:allophanate hydrolase subunit 1 [Pelagibacterium halotolerans]|uniref:5-oxoprolinase subunit B family protein n=1 Tax=Pelagibacterium halotolerans TaxID=531813 RepID=UPI00384AEA9E